jgi:hypothetical protein
VSEVGRQQPTWVVANLAGHERVRVVPAQFRKQSGVASESPVPVWADRAQVRPIDSRQALRGQGSAKRRAAK